MADNPLQAKAGLSVGDFKAGVSDINRSMRVLSSEFKASAAALGDWTKDATGLENRIGFLNKSIDLQKEKITALKTQLAQQTAEGKLSAAAQQEMTIKINRATEELNKMTVEVDQDEQALQDLKSGSDAAGNSVQELGQQSSEASGGMETLKSVAGGLWGALKVGVGAVVALVAVIATLAGAIGGLVFTTTESAAALNDLSLKTGVSTTRLQELDYVANQVGTSQESIVSSLTKLTRSMGTAQQQQTDYAAAMAKAKADGKEFDGQLGDSAAAFQKLGVSTTDASGNLRDNEAVFADTITALGKIPNEAERDALAMSIFGKSAQELNPLIKAGAEEIAKLSKEAHDVGAVMSEDTVQGFADFSDTLDSLKAGLQGTLGTLAGIFLPGFQSTFDQAGGYLKTFAGIVKGSNGDVGKIVEGVAGLLQTITADIARQAPKLLESGLTILQTIIKSFVTGLPAILPVAIQLIQMLIDFLVQNLPMMLDAGIQLLLSLTTGILTALPGLVEAALKMIITLANGLTAALPQMIPMLAKIIPEIIRIILENLPLLIEAAGQLLTALAQGLSVALPILIEAIPGLVSTLTTGLYNNREALLLVGVELVIALASGIGQTIWAIGEAAGDLFLQFLTSINPNFSSNAEKLMLTGYNIVRGVWTGIQNARDWFYGQIANFFSGLVGAAMDAIGAHSPADAFMPVGNSIPLGVGVGIMAAMPALERDLGRAMSSLARNYNIDVNARLGGSASAGASGKGSVAAGGIHIGNINIDARGATDPKAVGQAASDGVLRRLRAVGAG